MKKIVLTLIVLGLIGCAGQVDVKKIVEGAADGLKAQGMTCNVSKDSTSVSIGCEDSTTVVTVNASVTNKVKPVAVDTVAPVAADTVTKAPVDTAAAVPVDTAAAVPADTVAPVVAPAPADTVAPAAADTVAPAPVVPEVKDSTVTPKIDSIPVPAEQEIKAAQAGC